MTTGVLSSFFSFLSSFFSFLAFLDGDGPAAEAEFVVEFVFEDFALVEVFEEVEFFLTKELVVSGGSLPAKRYGGGSFGTRTAGCGGGTICTVRLEGVGGSNLTSTKPR